MSDRCQERGISVDREITASWLTASLKATAHLPSGEVTALEVEHWRNKTMSMLYRLHATYSQAVELPDRFVLKLSRRGAQSSAARRRRWKEHEFYTQLAPLMATAPVPRCFAASLSPGAVRSHLLLEDLSATHTKPPSPLPPATGVLHGNVDCLASIHAAWWRDHELSQAVSARDEAWIEAKTKAVQRLVAQFFAKVENELPPPTCQAVQAVAAAWPAIVRRSTKAPLTVVHGDAHPWNFLTPLTKEPGQTLLLDWEAWSIEAGPHDLASLIALHVPAVARPALEDALLDRYVARLQCLGVVGYECTDCREDYRRSVARRVISPISMWSRGSNARVWRPMLERISTAYHDLHCEELLKA